MRKYQRNILPFLLMALIVMPVAIADDQDDDIQDDDISVDSVWERDLRVHGGWTELTIGPNDLVDGAGSDLSDTYESTSDATLIDIHKKKYDEWRLDIRRSDHFWNNNLNLYARRTGEGHGPGSINGGYSYVEILDVEQELFSGRGQLNNIPLQYQLTGVSLRIRPGIYGTTIIFTLVEQ